MQVGFGKQIRTSIGEISAPLPIHKTHSEDADCYLAGG